MLTDIVLETAVFPTPSVTVQNAEQRPLLPLEARLNAIKAVVALVPAVVRTELDPVCENSVHW